MASPQKEHGHLDVANELAEALAFAPLSGSQFRLLWVLLRKTYGWQKPRDVISASQFVEATGLHRKVVERELRDLAEHRYIIAWGDGRHPKTYAIQKDYTRWGAGEVGTKMLPDEAKSGSKTVPTHSVSGSILVPNWEQNGSLTITTIQKPGATESHDSAPTGTLRDRYERQYQEASNKVAVIGELFSLLLGCTPNHRRLGAMAKGLNSGGKLMDLIIEASRQRISDDPHDYLAAMIKRQKSDVRPGKAGQADHNSPTRGKVVV